MGDRPHVILEKSRTVRRRYQRRKQQVVFSKAELERLERAEERDRRAKKLQEKEKRRIANKKKKLEKEAIAREERKKSGIPDPNTEVSSSQRLLSNFFGKKTAGNGGVRDKSETPAEDEGDTEVDSDNDCGSAGGDRVDSPEIGGTESDDSFDDDDALTLFNDENVLKGINGAGGVKDHPEPHIETKTESLSGSGKASLDNNGSMPQPLELSGEASKASGKQAAVQLPPQPSANCDSEKQKQFLEIAVKLSSQAAAEISESDPFEDDIVEEIFDIGPGDASFETNVAGLLPDAPLETPTIAYQNAEDVLAGLCTQDFEDDVEDDETCPDQRPPSLRSHKEHVPSNNQPVQPARQPLRDLGPASLNTKQAETTLTPQKSKATKPTETTRAQTTTTTTTSTADDEYGSFSFTDEDLLYLDA
jgi:hypothetical protein